MHPMCNRKTVQFIEQQTTNNKYKFIFIINCNLASPGTDSERQQNNAKQQCEYLYEIHLLCPAEIVSSQQVNESAFFGNNESQ